MNSGCVLDASALLALLAEEPGCAVVAEALRHGAFMSAVNFSETVAKLAAAGMPADAIEDAVETLGIAFVDFDTSLARQAGLLIASTRRAGLSFGDRACLALAAKLGLPALTADRSWVGLDLPAEVRLIR